jgi:hypothetical protein
MLLAAGHEGVRPNGVPLLVRGGVVGRLTATAVNERERTGEQLGRDREAAEELELALAESGGLEAFRGDFGMSVPTQTEQAKWTLSSDMRKGDRLGESGRQRSMTRGA